MPTDATILMIPLEREELIARLRWIIRVRWFFGIAVWIAGLTLYAFPIGKVSGGSVIAIGAAILVYNWLFWFLERRIKETQPEALARRAPAAAFAQIAFDLIALTLVLHTVGGIENPLFAYYIFHMVIATLLLPIREAFALAGMAILLFAMLAVAEARGWLPHTSIYALQRDYRNPQFVAATLLAFASALIIAVFLGTTIARTLRAREADVVRLKTELGVRAQALEEANEALRQADVAKTQYFRQVSHDLKAPLAAQQSLLRSLLVKPEDFPAQPRSLIERAIVRGDHLLALLNNLLLLSRTRDTTRVPQREWTDCMERLHPILETQQVHAAEKGLAWRQEIAEPLPRLYVERGLLATLAENLLSNAIKYTPRGGTVAFALAVRGGELVMEVRDTGIGIAKADLPRIGEDYYRTDQAMKSGSPGTGLGMAIVRSIIAMMGGRLEIESELGRGTTVTVQLPVETRGENGTGETVDA